MSRGLGIAIGVAAAIGLLGSSTAWAFEEVGNRCAANDAVQNSTLIGDASNNPPPPYPQIPQGEGWVITRWRVEVGPGLGPVAQQLVVFRWPEESQSYRKVAESAFETVAPGTNEFQSRIPVMEFDHVGLYGPEKTLVCRNDQMSLAGMVEGPFPLNSSRRYEALGETGVPVVAIVEPDRDYDYYGDETQDECPWTAAYQTDCPAEKIDIVSTTVKRRAILAQVRMAYRASVDVFGQVSWQVRRKPGQGAASSRKGDPGLTVGLSAGDERFLVPPRVAVFRLPLPKPVLRRLGRLGPRQRLRAKLTVRATDFLNGEIEQKLTVKLPGRER
jgi:hypothetical protein